MPPPRCDHRNEAEAEPTGRVDERRLPGLAEAGPTGHAGTQIHSPPERSTMGPVARWAQQHLLRVPGQPYPS
eukprot:1446596-Alexandrium_andersonii.AAC.1